MTHRPIAFPIVLLVAGNFATARAEAQVFTPTYLSPVRSSDIGVYLNDGPGEFSVEGIWRSGFGEFDLGFRGGIADTDDLSVLIGADYRHPLAFGAPVAIAATGVAQGVLGEVAGAGVMAGLSIGPTFDSPGLSFTPYVHPRVGLIRSLGIEDWDLELLGDVGFDLRLSRLDIRFGINFDDAGGADWGVGLAWR